MKKFLVILTVVLIPLFVSVGCYHLHYSSSGIQQSMQMNPAAPGTEFKLRKGFVSLWFWGLMGKDIPVDEWISEKIGKGQVVTHLEIDSKASFVNGLVSQLTFGIYTPRAITITGRYYTAAPYPSYPTSGYPTTTPGTQTAPQPYQQPSQTTQPAQPTQPTQPQPYQQQPSTYQQPQPYQPAPQPQPTQPTQPQTYQQPQPYQPAPQPQSTYEQQKYEAPPQQQPQNPPPSGGGSSRWPSRRR